MILYFGFKIFCREGDRVVRDEVCPDVVENLETEWDCFLVVEMAVLGLVILVVVVTFVCKGGLFAILLVVIVLVIFIFFSDLLGEGLFAFFDATDFERFFVINLTFLVGVICAGIEIV